jgi:DNA-binding transcriptional regulator YdaS (Cro superfamily)
MIDIVHEAALAVGGKQVLAKLLKIKSQNFYRWRRVPAERVLQIEEVTKIPRHRLRPDLYPKGRRK